MNLHALITATLCFAMCFSARAEAQTVRRATYEGWGAYVIENELIRLHVVPEIGGRVIQFALGRKDFFWANPTLTGKTSPKTGWRRMAAG